MRAPKRGELPQNACKELDEIPFPLVALECEMRLLLAPFMRRLLNELLLYLFQVSPPL